MKNKKVLLFALALAAGVLFRGGHAFAATSTWTGGGGDTNMNTAGNWDSAPAADGTDDLVFPETSAVDSHKTIVNNYSAATSFNSITFNGDTTGSTHAYSITGNSISLVAGMTESSTGSGVSYPVIDLDLAISADQSFTGRLVIGSSGKTLSLGSHTLTISGTTGDIELRSAISGTGSITKTGDINVLFASTASDYSGTTTISGGRTYVNAPGGFGTSAVSIGSGVPALSVGFDAATGDKTLSNNISLGMAADNTYGNFYLNNYLTTSLGGGGGGGGSCTTGGTAVVLSGAVTLTSDIAVSGCATLKITGALSGAHTITALAGDTSTVVVASSNNTSNTTNGTQASQLVTKTYSDSLPTTPIYVGTNNIAIVTGARGDISIGGGILKGTGTVGNVYLDSGVIAPGLSPGVLNTSNLIFTGGEYQAELGGTTAGQFDQLNVTGTVALGTATTTLTVSRYNGFKPKAGDKFTIINNDGSDAVTGTFKDLAEGATWKVDGYVLSITYKGGDGNDVVVTVASVPATPNTGFGMMLNNPAMLLGVTTTAAVGILLASRKLATKKVRR